MRFLLRPVLSTLRIICDHRRHLWIAAGLLLGMMGWLVGHLGAARVVGRAVAPDGTEMCLVQECNWSPELFTTAFVYRKPAGPWIRHYYDHQDRYWGRSRVSIDTNAQQAIFYRGGSAAVSFNWASETYVLHRWNRTETSRQWQMPVGWTPGMSLTR